MITAGASFHRTHPRLIFLKAQGIESIYVRTKEIQNDLAHILLRYQKKGIRIYQVRDNGVPKKLTVVRPSHFKSFLYRFCTLLGLTRNAAGIRRNGARGYPVLRNPVLWYWLGSGGRMRNRPIALKMSARQ